jgi:hypothetical protein
MNWKGILSIAFICTVVGLMSGLALGMRGCGGGTSKVLQENAELKADVTRYKFLASEAEDRRAVHAERRNTAERALAANQAKHAADAGTIKTLQGRVKAAGRKRDERNDLIDAYASQAVVKDTQIDLMGQALTAAKDELEESYTVEARTSDALVSSEKRADKLEKHLLKERPKKILIGIGSAVGSVGVTLLSVYAAGQL